MTYYPARAAQRERSKVIDVGVHMFIYICICGEKINFESCLAIDSLFQTFALGLPFEFID